jgi:3-oxoacyl-[acyl-carrier protein] reductase
MKLKAKNVVITGASVGLGRAIAETFAREGANLLLCARSSGPLEQAARELQQKSASGQKILFLACDVSNEKQVKALAARAIKEFGGCDVLINNAGIHGAKGPLEEVPWEEWRRTIEVDLFGVILPCRSFIPLMKKAGRGRIINISGGGATGPRPFFSAYAAAKVAVVRTTEILAEELRPHGIAVNAVAPGPMNTRLVAEAVAVGPEKIGEKAYAEMLRITQGGDRPPELAAGLCLFLAGPESDGITGKLISAPWDPWTNLAAHRDELAASDIYTLRRIVPEDRGKKWESPQ